MPRAQLPARLLRRWRFGVESSRTSSRLHPPGFDQEGTGQRELNGLMLVPSPAQLRDGRHREAHFTFYLRMERGAAESVAQL
jgi:hypothetical protein